MSNKSIECQTLSAQTAWRLMPIGRVGSRLLLPVLTCALAACGESGSGDDSPDVQNDGGVAVPVTVPTTGGDGTVGADPDTGTGTVDSPEFSSTEVRFDITVPAYQSDELQLDVLWGTTSLQASWVADETWTTSAQLPLDTEERLYVSFHDHFGSTTLATFETSFRTSVQAAETYTIAASEFDSDRWDNDEDGVSNLDELTLGTDPDFVEIAGAPDPVAELISIEYSGYDLELFWTRAVDTDGVVIGYDIYRNDEQLTSLVDALSFYDGSVLPETEYTYDVYSVDNEGYRSRAATLVLTTPIDEPVTGVDANTATLTGGGNSSWYISDGLSTSTGSWNTGSCSYGAGAGSGVGITDASLPDRYDAFDFASLMWVNGEQVGGWLRSANDSTSNFSSVPMADLTIATEYHAISTQPVLRNYTSFTNDTPDDIFIVVNVASNFGADNGNQIVQSSSGDLEFGADDRWVITDDYSTEYGDPTNTTVLFGPDSPVSNSVFTGSSVFNCWGDQGLTARIDVVIPAGETRALMFFHGLSQTFSQALDLATLFDVTPTPGSELAEGLTETQLFEAVNWNY